MHGLQVLDQRFHLLDGCHTSNSRAIITPNGLNAPSNTSQGISTYWRTYTVVVCNQSILLLDGLSYQTDEHHLPRATGFKAPVTHLMNPLLSVETGLLGVVTSHMKRPGVGLGCQRL